MSEYHVLTLDEIDDEVVSLITDIVDGYFLNGPLVTIEVLDRLETHLFRKAVVLPGNLDDPVCKRVMAVARKAKKELEA